MIEAFSMYALIAVDCKLQDFIMFEQVPKKMPLQLVIHKSHMKMVTSFFLGLKLI